MFSPKNGLKKLLLVLAPLALSSFVQAGQSDLPTVVTTMEAVTSIGSSANKYLAAFTWAEGCDDHRVKIWSKTSVSKDAYWRLTPVPVAKIREFYSNFEEDDAALYYVQAEEKIERQCAQSYLSGAYECGGSANDRRVRLWHQGDENGVQWWNVINNPDGSITLENWFTRNHCTTKHAYLGTDAEWATRYYQLDYTGLNFNWHITQPAGGTQVGYINGKWSQVARCSGCEESEYKYTVGVSAAKEESWLKSQSTWASVTVSHELETNQGVAKQATKVEASGGASLSTEEAVSKSFSISQGEEQTHTCKKSYFFQWVTAVQQKSVGGLRASVANSSVFLCTENGNPSPLMRPKT